MNHRERLIRLNLVPGVGSIHLRRLLEAFVDLDRLWTASTQELQQVEGIGPVLAQRLVAGCRDEATLQRELALAKREGVTIVTLEDAAYPKPLRTIPDPPLALYVRGRLSRPMTWRWRWWALEAPRGMASNAPSGWPMIWRCAG